MKTFRAEREKAALSAQRMSDVFSEFRASLMVMEFENTALAWHAQAQLQFFAVIRANPSYPWFKYTRLRASIPTWHFDFPLICA
ncbi:MAG: hypothetical protein NTZ94_16605 [Verrucomicrobia bacterium]|nr:hypothetical protein [Verrucomicrobiota bacterium]